MKISSPWIVALLVCAGCSTEAPDAPAQSVAYSTATGPIELQVDLRWSVGDGDEYDLGDDVTVDEDEGEYGWSGVVKLGPVEECAKPYDERSPDAVCGWNGPSDWWNIELDLRPQGAFVMSFWAGDADTDGTLRLPAVAIPTADQGPLRLSMSPDNASGFWGHVTAEVNRLAPDVPADDAVEDTTEE